MKYASRLSQLQHQETPIFAFPWISCGNLRENRLEKIFCVSLHRKVLDHNVILHWTIIMQGVIARRADIGLVEQNRFAEKKSSFFIDFG